MVFAAGRDRLQYQRGLIGQVGVPDLLDLRSGVELLVQLPAGDAIPLVDHLEVIQVHVDPREADARIGGVPRRMDRQIVEGLSAPEWEEVPSDLLSPDPVDAVARR